MKRFLLVFIDGIGLGDESEQNPFSLLDLPGFGSFSSGNPWTAPLQPHDVKGSVFKGIDAGLGVEGLPQSGTGQATLFSGRNCARIAGRHFGPFPHSTSIPVLKEYNIFTRVIELGRSAAFANAYPPIFFERVRERDRWSVTTRCCLLAGIPIRTISDLERGLAVSADITGHRLRERLSLDITPVTVSRAAGSLIALASRHAFTAFEYFLTDKAGHGQSHSEAHSYLAILDEFLGCLRVLCLQEDITLVITSDHGNLEDLGTRTHTMNPVPLAAVGSAAGYFSEAGSIKDIVPAIISALSD